MSVDIKEVMTAITEIDMNLEFNTTDDDIDLVRRFVHQQQAEIERLKGLVRDVAHIGVDFGYGEFELDESHIKLARKLLDKEL